MSDPSTEYKQYVLANLPSDIAIDPVTGFFLHNGHAFPTYLQASWYRNYIRKWPRLNFTVSALFMNSERGVYYDPSDLNTLFQDAAGTVPVTAPGQPVGLVLDKSGRGNHASQPTAAARPTLGRHPKGGRRNLLTQTENFADAVWSRMNTTIAQKVTAPDGTNTADTVVFDGTAVARIERAFSVSSPVTYSIWLRVASGTASVLIGTRVANAVEVTVTDTWQRFTMSASDSAFLRIRCDVAVTVFVWGAQVELGTVVTPYQKVTDQFDVTEAGVPDAWYLHFNGVNQFLSTPAINFTNSDEMMIVTGVQKLADTTQIVAELSANVGTNAGSSYLLWNSTGTIAFASRGSAVASAISEAVRAPLSRVITGLGKISSDSATIRLDGIQAAQNVADQGTGNYGNYPLYIGARDGTSLWFNGHLYGLVVRGKLPTEAELTATETVLSNTMRIAA